MKISQFICMPRLLETDKSDTRRWELADLQNLPVERVREFGPVFLALGLRRRLGLHDLLTELIEPGREEIAWADVIGVLSMRKFCG